MKKIALSPNSIKNRNKYFALVDDENFEELNKLTWNYSDKGYVTHSMRKNNKRKSLQMHRLIMNCPKEMYVDHIDHNPLNNQKNNLRICTSGQNRRNSRKGSKISNYKGVWIEQKRYTNHKYRATIRLNKTFNLGRFETEHQAALMYDFWAIELFGEFANTNFKVVAHG